MNNTYIFQNKIRGEDRIAVFAKCTKDAYDKLWDTIVLVPGLFTSSYKLFSIDKCELNQFKFSKIIKL